MPTSPGVWFYLFLGGLLVGLGAPFWYNAVTGLDQHPQRGRGTASADAQTRAAVVAAGAGTTQPATPVDAFRVSSAAQGEGQEGLIGRAPAAMAAGPRLTRSAGRSRR